MARGLSAAPSDDTVDCEKACSRTKGCQENGPDGDLRVSVLPWRRKDGWAGWMAESVKTESLVGALVIQAFATG